MSNNNQVAAKYRPLILTNSIDGTADVFSKIMLEKGESFFRWNIDLWDDYEIEFNGNEFNLTEPTGRRISTSDANSILIWRKPLIELMSFEKSNLAESDKEQARSQMRHCMLALVAVMRASKRLRLVEPHADRRLPKLFQLKEARDFFRVPSTSFSVLGSSVDMAEEVVSKSLGDLAVGQDGIFYTTRVRIDELFRPYPWFLQEALLGGQDITCVHIFGENYFYECDFHRDNSSIDWRVEINSDSQSAWRRMEHKKIREWKDAVNGYMRRVGLYYGRLDFILKDGVLIFLECNSNGQFGWLDDSNNYQLHRAFLAAANNPASAVS
jgi:hypothetical protein